MIGYRILAPIWTIAIAILSLVPGNRLPGVSLPYFDKMVHVLMYTLLVLLWALALNKQYLAGEQRFTLIMIILMAIAYGVLLEIIQEMSYTQRYFDIFDIAANGLGSLSGAMLFKILNKT